MSPKEYFNPLTIEFEANGSQEGANYMHDYMKGRFYFYGIKQSPRRDLFNQFVKKYELPDYDQLENYIHWLMEQPKREYHYCAMELVLKFKRKWNNDVLKYGEYLILNNSWWDTVDLTASNIIGAYLKKNKELIDETIPKWIESDNMWLNRTAMIFQLKYKDETSTKWLAESILPHIYSNEFFHQKAIGWALRQYSRFNSDWVIEFADNTELKPLSRREALRLL